MKQPDVAVSADVGFYCHTCGWEFKKPYGCMCPPRKKP